MTTNSGAGADRGDLLLGLDTGTSGTRALVIDSSGTILSSSTAEYPLSTPRPQWAEQSPEHDWWPAAVTTIRGALQSAGVDGARIAAVGLTGQMHGSVFLDRAGDVVRPALLWCDSRTGAECREMTEAAGGAAGMFRSVGLPVLASFTAPKVLWLRRHEPGNYARVAHLLLPKDYTRYRLTGEFVTDASDASGTALLDVRRRRWSPDACRAAGVDESWLPPVLESPEISGVVSRVAAGETGLIAGTPVVAGAGDQAAGGVGTGAVAPGRVSLSIGTSGVLFAHSDNAAIDPEMRIQTFCHAVPGAWHVMGCMLSSGGSLRWYRDTFAPGSSYVAVADLAAKAPAGCEGLLFLPYLTGERTPYPDPDARGVFFGATLRSGPEHFARAVLEGVAYSIRDSFLLAAEIGIAPSEVRVSGGGARSPLWTQMIADITGHPLRMLAADEGPAYGAALLAGVGAGIFPSVAEASESVVRLTDRTAPEAGGSAAYQRWYPIYRSLYPALRDAFAAASAAA